MIRAGFLSAAERKALVSLTRDGSVEHRFARRANAVLLLDDGFNCERVAEVLYLDDERFCLTAGIDARCQVHKARNIIERLPKPLHASVRKALRQA